MIVENIILRNVVINQGAAEVDNHISRDDIFDYHPLRDCKCYIYSIIPNRTLDPFFSTVCFLLDLPCEGSSKGNTWMKDIFFTKMVLFLTVWILELITDVRLNKLHHKKTDDVKLHTKQRHLNGDTLPYAILMQTRKFGLIRLMISQFCV